MKDIVRDNITGIKILDYYPYLHFYGYKLIILYAVLVRHQA